VKRFFHIHEDNGQRLVLLLRALCTDPESDNKDAGIIYSYQIAKSVDYKLKPTYLPRSLPTHQD